MSGAAGLSTYARMLFVFTLAALTLAVLSLSASVAAAQKWISAPGDLLILSQVLLFPLTLAFASMFQHTTRVFGSRPEERAPTILGAPRKSGGERIKLYRTVAGVAQVLALLYLIGGTIIVVMAQLL